MKSQKLILAIFFVSILIMSCSKNNDDEQYIESTPQYPMKSLMEAGIMELKNTKIDWVNHFEMGYKFKTFKNGVVSAVGIRVPDNGSYRVTLWNAETEEILLTKQVISTAGLLSFEEIDPIAINSGTAYFISVNTNDYYMFNDSGSAIFPTESGDILITAYGGHFGISQSLPSQYSTTSYIGMVDVKFIANN